MADCIATVGSTLRRAMKTLRAVGRVLLFGTAMIAAPITKAQEAVGRQGATNTVTPHDLIIEPPTLWNLGLEWPIDGDDTRNAAVTVDYRKTGDIKWRQGLPLFRLQRERGLGPAFPAAGRYVAPNMFAGSIFDLQPGTEYDVRLTMSDPDGIAGDATRILTMRTRPEPLPAAGGRTYHVYPHDWVGAKQEPSFTGLLAAYYMQSVGGDWYNAFPPRVKPGDIILVHAGLYKDRRLAYGHELTSSYGCCGTTGDGTYYLTAKGTAQAPIVIKAAGDGEVIFDGDGNNNLFNVMAADYNYFEGITFRNTFIAFEAGFKNITGAVGITIKRSKFTDIGIGLHTDWGGAKDFYVADNEFTGRHDPNVLIYLQDVSTAGGDSSLLDMKSQFAVKVYGSGHVIAYNKVRNFHDGIDHATYGLPDNYKDAPPEGLPVSIDIIGNDISNMHDNCVEVDGSAHNVRVLRNRCVNSGGQAFSMQPFLGGPAYFIRNVAYAGNIGGIKFSESPAGGIFYQNTWFISFSPGQKKYMSSSFGSNMHLRNNLFLSQNDKDPVLQMPSYTDYSSSDFNGFYTGSVAMPFEWHSMANGVPILRSFDSLASYSSQTGRDTHSILLDYNSFEHVEKVDAGAPRTTVYDPRTLDFRLKRRSPAIDRGTRLPNVNDDFRGKAADLGAVEFGTPLPRYGPRE